MTQFFLLAFKNHVFDNMCLNTHQVANYFVVKNEYL